MLSRILVLGTVLLAIQTVSAEDTPASSNPPIPQQTNASPARKPSHASGTALSDGTSNDATRDEQQRLLQQKCAELDRLQHEVTLLRAATGTPQQILVRVQVLEVSLTKLRNLGIDLDWLANGDVSGAEAGQSLAANGGRANTRLAETVARMDSSDKLDFVDGLKQNNLAKGLADSTVAVVSGRRVSVNQDGGEFPIPVPTRDGSNVAVEFKEYGTGFDLHALALGDNQVRLDVTTSVSEIDHSNDVEINGIIVPGMRRNEFRSVRELSFGQTAVLTGLVGHRVEAEVRKGKVHEEVNEVQLMVVVTPTIAPALEVSAASANRDINGAIRK